MNTNVKFNEEKKVGVEFFDIDFLPSYKIAELERQENEKERIAYYNEIQQRVANGEFNGKDGRNGIDGKDGEKGDKGDTGEKGDSPVKGTDYWTQEDISQIETHCNNYITQQLGTINSELAALTEVK